MFNEKIHYNWPFSIAMLNYQRVSSVIVLFVSFPVIFCLTQEKWKINDQVVSGVNPAYMEVSSRCFKSFVCPSVIHADSTYLWKPWPMEIDDLPMKNGLIWWCSIKSPWKSPWKSHYMKSWVSGSNREVHPHWAAPPCAAQLFCGRPAWPAVVADGGRPWEWPANFPQKTSLMLS